MVKRIFVVTLLVITLAVAVSSYFEDKFVYFPSKDLLETPTNYGLKYEQVNLISADGTKIMAWSILHNDKAPWLIYLHGNGENISRYLTLTTKLYELGINIFMLEYRGYGKNEGKPSELGLYQDAESAYQYVLEKATSANKIILYGYSLGSGVAVELATRQKISALILEAPYKSVPDVAKDIYRIVPYRLMKNLYASKDKISQVNVPLLIIHSSDDRAIPFSHGKALFDLAHGPKTFVEIQGGHTAMLNKATQARGLIEVKKFLLLE